MIKLATFEDVIGLAQLYKNYREYFNYPNLENEYENFLKKIITDNHSDILLYLNNNNIQGFVIVNKTTSTYYLGMSLWIIDLWIEQKYRGKGGVNEILNGLKNYASENKANSISFVTWKKLEKLCRFYLRKGFNLEPLNFYRMVLNNINAHNKIL